MTRTCLDLFAGLGGFSQAFEEADGWEVVTVEIEERFEPDIRADILDLRPSDLPDDPDVILASPPCTAFSVAAGNTHLDRDGNPVSEWGRESLTLVHHTVGLIAGLNPEWYVIENPMGGMRKVLGRPDYHVWWCQYGSDRAKPTDLWGELPPSFEAESCKKGEDDHTANPRGGKNFPTVKGGSSERAKIPFGLSEEILEAIENPEPVQKRLTEVDHE